MSCRFVGWQLSEDIVISEGFPVTMIISDNPTDQDFNHWCNVIIIITGDQLIVRINIGFIAVKRWENRAHTEFDNDG